LPWVFIIAGDSVQDALFFDPFFGERSALFVGFFAFEVGCGFMTSIFLPF